MEEKNKQVKEEKLVGQLNQYLATSYDIFEVDQSQKHIYQLGAVNEELVGMDLTDIIEAADESIENYLSSNLVGNKQAKVC